jgi:putative hemolysin
MSALQIVYLTILAVCILASGFFSGSETALVAVPRERVAQLMATDRRATRVVALTADPDRMLSTLLVANNFVNILGASVATVLFVDLLGQDWGPWAATAAVTAIVLLLGEITPKSLATRYPERFSLAVAPAIWRLSRFLLPVSRLFLALSRGLFRILRIKAQPGPDPVTEEDIRAMAELGERTGEIASAEREIIHQLFRAADKPVRDVMTPRTDLYTLEEPVLSDDVRAAVAATGHSRFPVIRNDLDHLIGILHVKDILRAPDGLDPASMRRLLRAPHYVPESKQLLELLGEMRSARRSFAVVLDEHGGVEGVVTVKDIVSELVGELHDEYDPGVPSMVALAEGEWLADGRVTVSDLADTIGVELPGGDYSTLGGLILNVLGRIPAEGTRVAVASCRFTVLHMDRNRIARVRVQANEPIT